MAAAVAWAAGWWLLWRIPTPRVAGGDVDVAIIVPARDEGAVIGLLLASLVDQRPPPAELMVVDDQSTDDTAAAARAGGATVVDAGAPPAGSNGKSWACRNGAAATAAEILVFIDADVTLHEGALGAVTGELQRRGGLVSVQPYHLTVRPYERLSAFFNLVAMMGVDAFSAARPRPDRTRHAFGPVLACRRADYVAVGGHEAIAGAVLDDVALAERFHAAGLPVTIFGGRGVVDFRMYPAGLGQLVEGWTKNIALGAGRTRARTMALVILWLSGSIAAAFLSPWAYGAYAVQIAVQLRRIGRFGLLTAVAYPVPLAAFLAIFVRSALITRMRRTVRWKGRDLATGP